MPLPGETLFRGWGREHRGFLRGFTGPERAVWSRTPSTTAHPRILPHRAPEWQPRSCAPSPPRSATPSRNALVCAAPLRRGRAMELPRQGRSEIEFRNEEKFPAGRLPRVDAGMIFPARGLHRVNAGTTFPARRLLRIDVGTSIPARRLPRADVGTSTPARRLPRADVGTSFPARRLLRGDVGTSIPARRLLRLDVGTSVPVRRLLRVNVGTSFPAPRLFR